MSFKTTFVLLVLVVGVGALWYFTPALKKTEADGNNAATANDNGADELALGKPLEAADIREVKLERDGRPTLDFKVVADPAGESKWTMTAPFESETESFAVTSLLGDVVHLRIQESFPTTGRGSLSPTEAGLDPPRATLTLIDTDDQTHVLQIGGQAPLSSSTYVRVDGEARVLLGDRDLAKRVLDPSVNAFRSKRVVSFFAPDAIRLTAEHAGKSYVLQRTAGDWSFETPVKAFAGRDQVTGMLTALSRLRIQNFVDESAARGYGFDAPVLRLTLDTMRTKPAPSDEDKPDTGDEPEVEERSYEILVGAPANLAGDALFVRRGDQQWIGTISRADFEKLIPSLAWRDPQVTRLTAGDASQLTIRFQGRDATLRKQENEWVGDGDLAKLDVAAVADVLEAFEELRAIDYIDAPQGLEEYGLAEPRASVTVRTVDDPNEITVLVGDVTRSGRNAYVKRSDQPNVIVVSQAQTARLSVAPLSLRSRTIFEAEPEAIRKIDIRRDNSRYVVERKNGAWIMTEPAGAPVDPNSVMIVANDIARLRARRVVDKDADTTYGLDAPRVLVTFTVDEPAAGGDDQAGPPPTVERTHTLRVAQRGTNAYLRIDDDPYVFELDDTVYQVMITEMIRRQLFDFTAPEIRAVHTRAPGGTLELAQVDGTWQYVPDPYVTLARSKVQELLDGIAGIRVEEYITWQSADTEAEWVRNAPVTVEIRTADDRTHTLKLEQERQGDLPRLGVWVEAGRVFRMRQADVERLLNGLNYYIKPETAQTP